MPILYFALLFVLAIGVGYYVYNNIYLPNKKDAVFKDVANANPNGKTITIYMFHVDWCPHCKKAMPEWQMFSDQYNGKSMNGYQIECKELDCTKSDDPQVKSMVEKYNLKQYPTIIGVVPIQNGKETRVDYDAKVKKQYLDQFVTSLTTDNAN